MPYCKLALRAYQDKLVAELGDRGVTLVAVSPKKADSALSMQEKHELTFTVVSDPGNQIGGQLGILMTQNDDLRTAQAKLGANVAATNADGADTLPTPTVVIVDAAGTIRWIDVVLAENFIHAAHTQAAYDQAREQHHGQLTEAQKTRIAQLVTDLPGIWNDPATPARERKRIARLLLTDVTVTRTSDTITAHVRLAGGQARALTLPVPEPAWKIRQAKPATITEIDKLLDHHTTAEIAAILQSRGLANGEGRPCNLTMVQRVIRTYHLRSRRQRLLDAGLIPLAQIAELLGVSPGTVKIWYHAGIVSGQRYNDKGQVLYNPPGPNPPARHQGRRHDTVRPA